MSSGAASVASPDRLDKLRLAYLPPQRLGQMVRMLGALDGQAAAALEPDWINRRSATVALEVAWCATRDRPRKPVEAR